MQIIDNTHTHIIIYTAHTRTNTHYFSFGVVAAMAAAISIATAPSPSLPIKMSARKLIVNLICAGSPIHANCLIYCCCDGDDTVIELCRSVLIIIIIAFCFLLFALYLCLRQCVISTGKNLRKMKVKKKLQMSCRDFRLFDILFIVNVSKS